MGTGLTTETQRTQMNFTLKTLMEVAATLPPRPKYVGWVMRPEIYRWMQSHPEIQKIEASQAERFYADRFNASVFGMLFYKKDQLMGVWKFEDRETMQRYLRDELSEKDLLLTGVECAVGVDNASR